MARWSAGHPWRAIAGWFVFVVLCLGALPEVADVAAPLYNAAGTAVRATARTRW